MKKLRKILVYISYNYFAAYLPNTNIPFFGNIGKIIRGRLFKLYTGSTGENINIQRKAKFGSSVKLGNNSGIGINSVIQGPTVIGENVMIAQELLVFTTNHNTKSIAIPMIQQGVEETKNVIIEDDVWIGSRVIILPGVTVGKGSILGAGSVVTKDVPPYSVVAGNPAVVKKKRINIEE